MNRELLHRSIRDKAGIDFARSGGPGGQNVNKVNSKAVVRVVLGQVEGLSEAEFLLARERLSGRLTSEDELVVMSDEERDQGRNRETALERLERLIAGAAQIPKIRRPTRPTRASRERRLDKKRIRSAAKLRRGRPELS